MSILTEQEQLTPKQKAFVDAYITNGLNGTEAAATAGYKGNYQTLASVAHENLNKPEIKIALARRHAHVAATQRKRIVNVYEEFTKNLEFVGKLRDAAQRWLEHPDRLETFTIDPRGDEIDIVYFDYEDKDQQGNPKRKTACLQDVLAKLQGTRYESDAQFIKTTDLREYALKTIDRIDTTLDKFAKMGGEYTKERENPQTWDNVVENLAKLILTQGLSTDIESARAAARESFERLEPVVSEAVN